jgi:hypothetical protein
VRAPVVVGLVAAVGVVSGVVGAVVATRLSAPPAPPAPPAPATAAHPVAPLAPAPPPGWDPRFLTRFSALEADVARLAAALEAGAPAPGEGALRGDPDVRLEHYVRDLAVLDKKLAEHGREARDPEWARSEEAILAKGFAARPDAAKRAVTSVECRSQTCVVNLRFASPDEALEQMRDVSSVYVEGCNGIITTFPPPKGPGAYEAPIVYTCR